MAEYRIERDSMGEVKVPADALYGAQTQRAVDNFPVSDLRFPRTFIRALGLIKKVTHTYRYYLTRLGRSVIAAACFITRFNIIPAMAQIA